jgi:hypothetical protein
MASFHQIFYKFFLGANLVLILKKIICISCPGFFHCWPSGANFPEQKMLAPQTYDSFT